jgi:hypothetical protein
VQAGKKQAYKFFIENKGGIDWESGADRAFNYPVGLEDTTLHWVDFDRRRPTGKVPVQSTVIFRVNMASIEALGLFNRGVGDRVIVIGAKGWTVGTNDIRMDFVPALQEWTAAEPFEVIPGTEINYKYFIRWDSSRANPASPNYLGTLGLQLSDGWEEPGITGGGNRVFTYQAAPQQSPSENVEFWDGVPQEGVITTPISVTWNVDMRPATDRATNSKTLFRPGTDSAFIAIDVPMLAVNQGLRVGSPRHYRLEDPDGDVIYSGTFALKTPTWYSFGFKVAYTTATAEIITTGTGVARGRRYQQFIAPAQVTSSGPIWPGSYTFPTVVWKEENLPVESPPLLTGVQERPAGIPEAFELAQNYPNPFNPETTIRYQLARTAQLQIAVYNVMGQLVKTLVDKKHSAGKYTIVWHGDNDQGKTVTTGVYFLKMKAGEFTRVRKMALLR